MNIGSDFPLDSERLARLQHEVYGKSIAMIVSHSQEQYRRAETILDVRTELGKHLPVSSFDHRTVEHAHDQIAAQFRYFYINKPRLFDSSEAGEDSDLFLKEWNDYLLRELREVGDWAADFYRLICVAVVFPNPDEKGIEAEEALYEIVNTRYRSWI